VRNTLSVSVLGILFATAVLADPPPGTIMKVTPPGPSSEAAKACVQVFQVRVSRLGELGARLKLTAQQQPLFDAWRKVMVESLHAMPCPPPPTGLSVPAPERLSNQIKMLGMTLDGLRKEKPAVEALYATLSPVQRAMFDGPVPSPDERNAPAPQAH
jgi:hypothetical protein